PARRADRASSHGTNTALGRSARSRTRRRCLAELFLLLAAHIHDRRFFSILRHFEHLDGHGFHAVVGDPPEEFRLAANGADVFAAEGGDAAGLVGLAGAAFGGVGHVVEPDARVLFLDAVVAIHAMPFHVEVSDGDFYIFGDEAAAENRLDLRGAFLL